MKSENRDGHSKRNFENLVNYYEKELKRIHEGESVSKLLNGSERGTLLRSGILSKRGSGVHLEWEISKEALDLLSNNRKHTRSNVDI